MAKVDAVVEKRRAVVEAFVNPGRRQALENMVYLQIADADDEQSPIQEGSQ